MSAAAAAFTFTVTWPSDIEPPMGCPKSYRVWFGTRAAMSRAVRGYTEAGAVVTP